MAARLNRSRPNIHRAPRRSHLAAQLSITGTTPQSGDRCRLLLAAGGPYSRYVGRVGALAVALGVGMAVAISPGMGLGVAHAHTDGDGNTAQDNAEPAPETEPPGNLGTAEEQHVTHAEQQQEPEEQLEAEGIEPGLESEDLETELQLEEAEGQGEDDGEGEQPPPIEITEIPTPTLITPSETPVTETTPDEATALSPSNSEPQSPVDPTEPASDSASAPAVVPDDGEGSRPNDAGAQTVAGKREFEALALSAAGGEGSGLPTESLMAAAAPGTPSPAPLAYQPRNPIDVVLGAPFVLTRIALTAVSMFLSGVFQPGPTTPSPPIMLFVVLGWAQREVQRSFFNRNPSAVADSTSTSENTGVTIAVLANDTDPDLTLGVGDVLTVTDYTQPANGAVVLNHDGTFTYTPNTDFEGTDTFTYTVSDDASPWHLNGLAGFFGGGRHNSTATVTVGVTAVNHPPQPDEDPQVGLPDADGVITGSVAAFDPDGDELTYTGSLVTVTGTKVEVESDGSFVYTPSVVDRHAAALDSEQNGTFSFTVIATDPSGASVASSVTIPVLPQNSSPTVVSVDAGVPDQADGGVVTGSVSATDPDGDDVSFAAESLVTPMGILVVNTDGTFTFRPSAEARHAAAADNAAQTGADQHTFTVVATDGLGAATPIAVTVAIDPANQPPQPPNTAPASSVDPATGEVSSSVGYTDPDFDTLTYTGPTTTAGGGSLIVFADGTFKYTPTITQRLAAYSAVGESLDTFDVVINDGHGSVQTVAVTVRIDPLGAAVTSTASTPGIEGYQSTAPDGTSYQTTRLGTGSASDPYRTVVTITHPNGATATTTAIPGQAYSGISAAGGGTAVLTTFEGTATRVTSIRPDGATVTSEPGAGYPSQRVIGSDGTIVQELYRTLGTDSSYLIGLVILHPDGSTTVTEAVFMSSLNSNPPPVVGADGTVAKLLVDGSGTAADPYESRLLVVHRHDDGSTTTTLTDAVSGKADSAVIGADGTAGLVTVPGRVSDDGPYWTNGVVVRPDGSQIAFAMETGSSYWSDPANRLAIGTDGTAAASNPDGSVAVVRSGAATIFVTQAEGPAHVGGDGSVYVRDFNGHVAIRPDGSTTTASGMVAVGADGTAYITSSASGNQTVVTAVRSNGITIAVATLGGTPSSAVQFDPGGNAYQVTYATSSGVTRTTVTRIGLDQSSTIVLMVDGMPYGPVQFDPDGVLYQFGYDQATGKTVLGTYRPSDGVTRTSVPVDGTPKVLFASSTGELYVLSAADGTVAFKTGTANTTTLAVLRPDGSTDVAPSASVPEYSYSNSYDVVIRPDGVVYTLITGDGQTALSVIRADGTAFTSAPVEGSGSLYRVIGGPGGDFAFTTYRSTAGPEGTTWSSRLTVVRADGSTITSDGIGGSDGQPVIGADGTAAMALGTNAVVIHPNGDQTTTGPVAGFSYSRVTVNDTGTVYQLLSGSTGTNYYLSAVIVIRPDGTTSDPIMIDGLGSEPILGPDGEFYLSSQIFPSGTTTFTVFRPDGTFTTAPPIAGLGQYYGGGLVVAGDGTVYETTYRYQATSDGDPYRTTVRVFRPTGDVHTVTMGGTPDGGVVITPEGDVKQKTYDDGNGTTSVYTISIPTPATNL